MNQTQDYSSSSLLRQLLDPLQYERPHILVDRLVESFNAAPRTDGVHFFEQELQNPIRSLHFQFILLQTAARLPWFELLDLLRTFILSGVPIQLVKAALRAMVAIHGLTVYRFCGELVEKCLRPEITELAKGQIELLIHEDRMIRHLHAVLNGVQQHRDPFSGLERLAAVLSDKESRGMLVLPLRQLTGVELAVVGRLAGLCADQMFTGPLLNRLQLDWSTLSAVVMKELLRALGRCVGSTRKGRQIGQALEKLFPLTPENLKESVLIWSWPLLDEGLKSSLFERFTVLKADEKVALLESLPQEASHQLAPIVLNALEWESDDQIFQQLVEWLLGRGYTRECLDCLGGLSGPRLHLLLSGICKQNCQAYLYELLPYFHAGVEDDLLVCMAGALLKKPNIVTATRAWELLNSGVSLAVRSALIRRLPDWLPLLTVPLGQVFAVCQSTPSMQTEWLISWSRLLGRSTDPGFRLQIIDGVLVLFERIADTDPLPYVDFFRRLHFQSPQELRLVRDEVQLICNTLLRSASRPAAGRLLAELLRELDKKMIREKLN